jgi:hypothetical protein
MYLNLITPLFRSGMLSKVKESIPKHEDINWIIVLCSDREILKKECNDLNLPFLEIHAPEGQGSVHLKVNHAIEHMRHGFFLGIDDDTTFNPNAYEIFKKHQDKKMIIGEQMLKDGSKRPAQKPKHCYTDGAQAMIHADIIGRLGDFTKDPVADCNFLLSAWDKCKEEEVVIVNEVMSNYNFLR